MEIKAEYFLGDFFSNFFAFRLKNRILSKNPKFAKKVKIDEYFVVLPGNEHFLEKRVFLQKLPSKCEKNGIKMMDRKGVPYRF